jgi:hypothetical protein
VRTLDEFKLFALVGAGRSHGYVIPALQTELLWIGAYPASLIASLSYSPLQAVKADGPLTKTPPGWVRYRDAGGTVAAPPSWPVKRPLVLTCTGPFDGGPVVALGVKFNPVPCAYFPPKTTPVDGLTITDSSQLPACPISFAIKLAPAVAGEACSDPLVQPQELQVEITGAKGHTYITVGLGDATTARRVLGSAS